VVGGEWWGKVAGLGAGAKRRRRKSLPSGGLRLSLAAGGEHFSGPLVQKLKVRIFNFRSRKVAEKVQKDGQARVNLNQLEKICPRVDNPLA